MLLSYGFQLGMCHLAKMQTTLAEEMALLTSIDVDWLIVFACNEKYEHLARMQKCKFEIHAQRLNTIRQLRNHQNTTNMIKYLRGNLLESEHSRVRKGLNTLQVDRFLCHQCKGASAAVLLCMLHAVYLKFFTPTLAMILPCFSGTTHHFDFFSLHAAQSLLRFLLQGFTNKIPETLSTDRKKSSEIFFWVAGPQLSQLAKLAFEEEANDKNRLGLFLVEILYPMNILRSSVEKLVK